MRNSVLLAARQELLAALPQAIQRALESYTDFASNLGDDAAGDAKSYAAHHAGLKAAISHLEALLKLGRLVMAEDQADQDRIDDGADTLPSLIEKAQATLQVLDQDSPPVTDADSGNYAT